MQKLTITIETDVDITEEDFTALGAAAADYTTEALKPYWNGATIQSSKVEVTKVTLKTPGRTPMHPSVDSEAFDGRRQEH